MPLVQGGHVLRRGWRHVLLLFDLSGEVRARVRGRGLPREQAQLRGQRSQSQAAHRQGHRGPHHVLAARRRSRSDVPAREAGRGPRGRGDPRSRRDRSHRTRGRRRVARLRQDGDAARRELVPRRGSAVVSREAVQRGGSRSQGAGRHADLAVRVQDVRHHERAVDRCRPALRRPQVRHGAGATLHHLQARDAVRGGRDPDDAVAGPAAAHRQPRRGEGDRHLPRARAADPARQEAHVEDHAAGGERAGTTLVAARAVPRLAARGRRRRGWLPRVPADEQGRGCAVDRARCGLEEERRHAPGVDLERHAGYRRLY